MAENWRILGFIVQRPSFGPEPIFVETERGHKKCICLPKCRDPPIPSWDIPSGIRIDDAFWNSQRELLWNLLREAMKIELTTIPLYLFAMYSIKSPANPPVNDPGYSDPVASILSLSSLFLCAEIVNLLPIYFYRCCR